MKSCLIQLLMVYYNSLFSGSRVTGMYNALMRLFRPYIYYDYRIYYNIMFFG